MRYSENLEGPLLQRNSCLTKRGSWGSLEAAPGSSRVSCGDHDGISLWPPASRYGDYEPFTQFSLSIPHSDRASGTGHRGRHSGCTLSPDHKQLKGTSDRRRVLRVQIPPLEKAQESSPVRCSACLKVFLLFPLTCREIETTSLERDPLHEQ